MRKEIIVEPNEHIFRLRDKYIKIVQETLPGRRVELVGGMAVPMIGRPELDILVLTEEVEGDTEKLESIGFKYRGVSDNAMIPLRSDRNGPNECTGVPTYECLELYSFTIESEEDNVIVYKEMFKQQGEVKTVSITSN